MQTGFYIPGGMVRERLFPGEPVFPTDPEFPITERHTAYEWAMALGADEHPYAHRIAELFGPRGLLHAPTIEGMKARENALESWPNEIEPEERLQPRAIYYALRAEVEAGHLEPLRREWCIDRPGLDPPDVPDFTRSVFGIEQILPLVRRRGDSGQLIRKLLAPDAGESVADEAIQAALDGAKEPQHWVLPTASTSVGQVVHAEPPPSRLPVTGSIAQFVAAYIKSAAAPSQKELVRAWHNTAHRTS
jgi:hypothetical protein